MGYKCSFCGAEYSRAIDRARCEFACDEKYKQAAEEEKRKKLIEERTTRYEECVAATKQAEKLWTNYLTDYGSHGRMAEAEKALSFLVF